MNILDLGCGNKKCAGAVGIDINPRSDADVIHDLNSFPYPFADSSFDEIIADNILEHLDDVVAVMEELSRIGKPGALTKIIVPYFRARWAFIDPTHKRQFTAESFSFFDPDHIHNKLYKYSQARFKLQRLKFNEGLRNGPFKSVVISVADRWPVQYETYLSHVFPLDQLTFYLVNIK